MPEQEPTIREAFEAFVTASDIQPTILAFNQVIKACGTPKGYPALRDHLLAHGNLSHVRKSLITCLDSKWALSIACRNQISTPSRIVISGAGPCGLRAAVEACLCGHRVHVVELRNECSRHNILKTWQPTIDDMMQVGLSWFVPGFKPHGHLHLGTREMQLCLLKAACMFGADFSFSRGTCGIVKRDGWNLWTLPQDEARTFLHSEFKIAQELALQPGAQDTSLLEQSSKVDFFERATSEDGAISQDITTLGVPEDLLQLIPFDSLIVAEGESSRLIRRLGFDRKVAKYNEAIGIVVNLDFSPLAFTKQGNAERMINEFVAWRTAADWQAGPIGKVVAAGVDIENIEYMRGTSTHFIAVTTKQKVLQQFGIVKELRDTVRQTLSADNMDFDLLRKLARILASACGIPDDAPLATKHGVQVFDFSCRGQLVKPMRRLDEKTIVLPAGDALINPFWPQGLGINRGFHNAMDAVWAAHCSNIYPGEGVAEIERAFTFRLIDWMTFSVALLAPGKQWTCDPATRYSALVVKSMHAHDIEHKATESSIPVRYHKLYGIQFQAPTHK